MSEYREMRIVAQDVPVVSRHVVETLHDSVGYERRGMSAVTVAALMVAAIIGAVVITMLIINSQQRNNDEELARERARTTAAQQMPGQPQQQPVIVNMPPAGVPALYPVAGPAQPAPIDAPLLLQSPKPSSASIEIEVTSRLQNDEVLRPFAILVTVTGGVATLSGHVPDEDLKKRAEKLARAVNGVQRITNEIAVRP